MLAIRARQTECIYSFGDFYYDIAVWLGSFYQLTGYPFKFFASLRQLKAQEPLTKNVVRTPFCYFMFSVHMPMLLPLHLAAVIVFTSY
jgi:hypothetical protein